MKKYDYYISVPITGQIEKAREKSFALEAKLARAGFTFFNPVRLSDDPALRELSEHAPDPWAFWMEHATAGLRLCKRAIFLEGWEESKGCCEEADICFDENIPDSMCLPTLFLLTGKKRSGKDTFSMFLDAATYSLASPLKEIYKSIFVEDFPDENKHLDNEYGINRREFLQWFGTEIMQFELSKRFPGNNLGRSIWVENLKKRIYTGFPSVAITDVRFPHEVQALQEWGKENLMQVITVKIIRPGLDSADTHASETELDNIFPDVVILNEGTIQDLKVLAENLRKEWT